MFKTIPRLMVLISAALAVSFSAEAKPISYVDGVMVMQENDETGHTISVDYGSLLTRSIACVA